MALIFVFGSNEQGLHAGGSAKTAIEKYGAHFGKGEGKQGLSYAIPTMEGFERLQSAVERFINYAKSRPDACFYVTPIGCGIAGYKPEQIAPLFLEAPFNVALCMVLVHALKECK